jgi:hypothetical protein
MESSTYIHFRAPAEDSRRYVENVLGGEMLSGDALNQALAGSNLFIRDTIQEEMGIDDWWVDGTKFSFGGSRIIEASDTSVEVVAEESGVYADVWVLVLDF